MNFNMKYYLTIFLVLCSHRGVASSTFVDSLIVVKDSVLNFFQTLTEKIEIGLHLKQPKQQYQVVSKPQDSAEFSDNATDQNSLDESDEEYFKLSKERTAFMRTEQLVELHGRKAEIHTVVTEDGYILQIHRIVLPKTVPSRNKTILLQHGILGSSADWVILGRHNSLPYLLSDAGYDVWLLNARGNHYSRSNVKISKKSSLFWNFSFHEIGLFDNKAVIDYVRLRKKDYNKMYFIAHSVGASSLLVLLTESPGYNRYLEMGILLAPLATMSETKGPLRILASIIGTRDAIVKELLGVGEFFPRKIPANLAAEYCKGQLVICRNPLFFIAGAIKNTPLEDKAFMARLLGHVPAGTSSRAILHLAQLVRTGRFHQFSAPHQEYPLQRVSVPMVVFSSTDDMISTVPDVTRLFASVVNPVEHIVLRGNDVSHTEFVWGSAAPKLVFKKILLLLDQNDNKVSEKNVVYQAS